MALQGGTNSAHLTRLFIQACGRGRNSTQGRKLFEVAAGDAARCQGQVVMSAVVAGAAQRFELSIEDLRNQARAVGFWRGLTLGFVGAFFLFDGALRRGAAVDTVISFAAANMIWGAATAVLALMPLLLSAVRAGRARREKLERLRARLCD